MNKKQMTLGTHTQKNKLSYMTGGAQRTPCVKVSLTAFTKLSSEVKYVHCLICTTKDAFELDAVITFSKEQGRGGKMREKEWVHSAQ